MKLSFSGWARDHGENVILEESLGKGDFYSEVDRFTKGKIYVTPKSKIDGNMVINNGAVISFDANCRLNGDYLARVFLSREEIAQLFFLTHRDESWGAVACGQAEFDRIKLRPA